MKHKISENKCKDYNIVQNGKQTLNKRKFDRKNILDVIIYKRHRYI